MVLGSNAVRFMVEIFFNTNVLQIFKLNKLRCHSRQQKWQTSCPEMRNIMQFSACSECTHIKHLIIQTVHQSLICENNAWRQTTSMGNKKAIWTEVTGVLWTMPCSHRLWRMHLWSNKSSSSTKNKPQSTPCKNFKIWPEKFQDLAREMWSLAQRDDSSRQTMMEWWRPYAQYHLCDTKK